MSEEPINFEEAMARTADLLLQIESHSIDQEKAQREIEALVHSLAGARGFLVTYLTGDFKLADTHPQSVVNALKKHAAIVSDLVVKNIVMSSTMAVTHGRNSALKHRAGSQRVTRRSQELCRQMADEKTMRNLAAMASALKYAIDSKEITADEKAGEELVFYSSFLKRWNYDVDQLQSAQAAIVDAIKRM